MTFTEWLKTALTPSNIIMMLCASAVFVMGVERFQNKTDNDIADLRREVNALKVHNDVQELRLRGRRTFMACAVRTIDAINREVKATPPCSLDVAE